MAEDARGGGLRALPAGGGVIELGTWEVRETLRRPAESATVPGVRLPSHPEASHP